MLRLLFVLAILGAASAARANPLPRPALHWSRAEDAGACIDPHSLALRVTALTGPVLVDATEADVSIEGHIQRRGAERYEAHIAATGRDGVARGSRTLQHDGDCRALDDALAFVIALLIDPDLVLEQLPPTLVGLGAESEAASTRLMRDLERSPPVAASPALAPAVAPAPPRESAASPPEPAPADASPTRTIYQLHLGATLGIRELPRASAGPYLAVSAVPLRWLGLDLAARATFMPGPLELAEGRALHAQRFAASVLACPRYPWSAAFLELCAGPEVALVRAQGSGFSTDKVARRVAFVAQIAAGLGALLRGAWWLRVRANLQLLLNDPSFSYEQEDGERTAFRISRVAGSFDLGVGYQF